MPRRKKVGGFVWRLVFIYALLMAPWPGVTDAYAAIFRAGGNVIFHNWVSTGVVHFRPLRVSKGPADTEIIIKNRIGFGRDASGNLFEFKWDATCNSRHQGYLPTIALIALILATPIAWRRRWKAMTWGLLLVHLFIALRMAVWLLRWSHADSVGALFTLSPLMSSLLQHAAYVVSVSPVTTFIVPVFIWIVVVVRREDLREWRAATVPGGGG